MTPEQMTQLTDAIHLHGILMAAVGAVIVVAICAFGGKR